MWMLSPKPDPFSLLGWPVVPPNGPGPASGICRCFQVLPWQASSSLKSHALVARTSGLRGGGEGLSHGLLSSDGNFLNSSDI